MPIVWTLPDGSLSIMRLSPRFLAAQRAEGETTAQTVLRVAALEQQKQPALALAVPVVVPSTALPSSRRARQKWRLQNGRVEVDPTIPDPPPSRQQLAKAAIDAALADPTQLPGALQALRDTL